MKIRFIIAAFLICCLFLCSSCKNNTTASESSTPTENMTVTDPLQDAEVKYVISVSINPQVSLSCDADDIVVDVHFDNNDAKIAYADMKWVGKKQSDCLVEMVIAAKKDDYLKDGDIITLKVMACSDEQLIANILAAAQANIEAATKAENLNITVLIADNETPSPATDNSNAKNPSPATDNSNAKNPSPATDNSNAKTPSPETDSSSTGNTSSENDTPTFSENDLYGNYSKLAVDGEVAIMYFTTIERSTFEYSYTELTPYDPELDSPEDLQYAQDIGGVLYIGRQGDGNLLEINQLTKESLTVVSEEDGNLSEQKFKYDPVAHTLTFTQVDEIVFNAIFLNVELTKK